MTTPRLDVLICTIHADGLRRVAAMGLPHVDGVRYIVSWQMPGDEAAMNVEIPVTLRRDDIQIHRHDSRGLSRNRNVAFGLSDAPYMLVADDDLSYSAEALSAVIRAFDEDPSLDVAQLMYTPVEKPYPTHPATITMDSPRGLTVTSFEMALRRRTAGHLRFNELFGIGSGMFGSGEDPLLMLTAVRSGLNCRFLPVTIARHDGPTTGCRAHTPEVSAGEGALIYLRFGLRGMLRVPLFVWRRWRSGLMNPLTGLWHVTRGYIYAMCHRRDILSR